MRPFTEPPISDLHISPFLTRDKPGAKSCKVVVDLSFPHGASVNTGVDPDTYLGSEFLLTLDSVDYITKFLNWVKDHQFIKLIYLELFVTSKLILQTIIC